VPGHLHIPQALQTQDGAMFTYSPLFIICLLFLVVCPHPFRLFNKIPQTRYLFITDLKAVKSKVKVLADLMSGESPLSGSYRTHEVEGIF
jgi:hypothetical protein